MCALRRKNAKSSLANKIMAGIEVRQSISTVVVAIASSLNRLQIEETGTSAAVDVARKTLTKNTKRFKWHHLSPASLER